MTFSVRAAGELRLRLADLLGEQVAAAVTAATFHSVCARMLREDAALFGRTEDYTIYDQADMRHVIEWLLSDSKRRCDPGRPGRLRPAGLERGARRRSRWPRTGCSRRWRTSGRLATRPHR